MASGQSFSKLIFFISLLGCATAIPNFQKKLAHSMDLQNQVYNRSRTTGSAPLAVACRKTPYPQLCTHILLSSSSPSAPLNRQVADVSRFALGLTSSSYHLALHLSHTPAPRSAPRTYKGALQDCTDLMSNTMDQLRLSISRLSDLKTGRSSAYSLRAQVMDAQVSLSASYTFQGTCSDELLQCKVPAAAAAAAPLLRQVGDTERAVAIALALADKLQHRGSP